MIDFLIMDLLLRGLKPTLISLVTLMDLEKLLRAISAGGMGDKLTDCLTFGSMSDLNPQNSIFNLVFLSELIGVIIKKFGL